MVSIIVPTYNRSSLLIETINSILSQTFSDFELIIVSDGSTDDTAEMVLNVDDERIALIELEKNYGYPSVARNRGIDAAKGDYLAFCDDDDLWEENKLMAQLEKVKEGKDFVFTNVTYFENNTKTVPHLRGRLTNLIFNFLPQSFAYIFFHLVSWIPNSGVLLSKELLGVNRFSEDERYRASEDYELWLRIFRKARMSFINSGMVIYRVHQNNISANIGENFNRCALIFKERESKSIFDSVLNKFGYIWYKSRFYFNSIR